MKKYSRDHEFVIVEGNKAKIGISDHAQDSLGDIVFVELPEVDDEFNAGDVIGTVESVKAVSDIMIPISGKVLEANEALLDAPDTINSDAEGKGWIVVMEMSDVSEVDSLMSEEEYAEFLKEE